MDMQGERRIPAPRQLVWERLNDPETLKQCIPGCEIAERLEDERVALARDEGPHVDGVGYIGSHGGNLLKS